MTHQQLIAVTQRNKERKEFAETALASLSTESDTLAHLMRANHDVDFLLWVLERLKLEREMEQGFLRELQRENLNWRSEMSCPKPLEVEAIPSE
jgi:hypothetical protein